MFQGVTVHFVAEDYDYGIFSDNLIDDITFNLTSFPSQDAYLIEQVNGLGIEWELPLAVFINFKLKFIFKRFKFYIQVLCVQPGGVLPDCAPTTTTTP